MKKVKELLEERDYLINNKSLFDFIFINKKTLITFLITGVVSLTVFINNHLIESVFRYNFYQELATAITLGVSIASYIFLFSFVFSNDFRICKNFQRYIESVFPEDGALLFKKYFSSEIKLNSVKYKIDDRISEINSTLATERALREWHSLLLSEPEKYEKTLDLFVYKMKEYNASKNAKSLTLNQANKELYLAGFNALPNKDETLSLKINEH